MNNSAMMKSSIEELMAFMSIVDTGSIVAAATQLQQTPSGISYNTPQKLDQKIVVNKIE